jgi:hypothetical protein
MSASPAQTVFGALPGAWTLRREIDNARFGGGMFEGRATLTAQTDGALLYEEHGELRLGAWRGPAWRRWIYALEGDALVIRYPGTNAELHAFRFEEDGSAAHVHFCDPDRYSALLQRLPGGNISLSYDVTGPAKDYRLRTLLTREY